MLGAKAQLAVAYDGAPVEIVEEPIVDLKAVRHPLLALRAVEERRAVTPNDLALGEVPGRSSAKVLVVSGPNAGGKTVLLKAVGFAALLARAGMQVPAEPGSRVGFFSLVLADIGDQQSVLGDLSTFSAHLAIIGGILATAAESALPVLILCDELMAGTHPDQGAALARATLEALVDAPGLVITTTHYDSLKALTESDARFRNAGMEYDLANLRPTFRLKDGVPGRSYALDIAARMGLPQPVLARARELLGGTTLGLEEVLRNLEAREAALVQASAALDGAKRELEEARDELETRAGDQRAAAQALTRRERELALRSREAIDEAVREARDAIAQIVKEARKARTLAGAETARQALEQTARAATASMPEPPPLALDVDKLRDALATRALGLSPPRGHSVSARSPHPTSSRGGPRGEESKGSDRLHPTSAAGGGREGGRGSDRVSSSGDLGGRGSDRGSASADEAAIQVRANTVDLRGLRADEALTELQSFLDHIALEGSADTVFVIHGHGTGALRKAVREYLATSPYVERFRAGGAGEGGDGVSVVSLKG